MKKYFLGIFAAVLAVGMSAFTVIHQKQAEATQQEYYWFDLNGGYEGRSASVPTGCDLTHTRDCAYGYINVDDPNNPTQPSGQADLTAKKQ